MRKKMRLFFPLLVILAFINLSDIDMNTVPAVLISMLIVVVILALNRYMYRD